MTIKHKSIKKQKNSKKHPLTKLIGKEIYGVVGYDWDVYGDGANIRVMMMKKDKGN